MHTTINHFSEAVGRAGYFDNLEMKLAESTKGEPARIGEEIDRAKEALASIEKEITATFRFQLQSAGGTEAAQLTAQHLEKLGRDKKIVINRILEFEEIEHSLKDSAGLRRVIEVNIKELKRCFHKASPATKRRLIRKVLRKLVYQPKGLDAYFNFEEGANGSKPSSAESGEMGKLVAFKQKKQAEPALNLSSEFLRVEGIGWGARTRTWE